MLFPFHYFPAFSSVRFCLILTHLQRAETSILVSRSRRRRESSSGVRGRSASSPRKATGREGYANLGVCTDRESNLCRLPSHVKRCGGRTCAPEIQGVSRRERERERDRAGGFLSRGDGVETRSTSRKPAIAGPFGRLRTTKDAVVQRNLHRRANFSSLEHARGAPRGLPRRRAARVGSGASCIRG